MPLGQAAQGLDLLPRLLDAVLTQHGDSGGHPFLDAIGGDSLADGDEGDGGGIAAGPAGRRGDTGPNLCESLANLGQRGS